MGGEQVLDELVEALRRLPGVGAKSAQRMAYHLLQHDRQGAARLAQALERSALRLHHCARCHTFTEHDLCAICRDPGREPEQQHGERLGEGGHGDEHHDPERSHLCGDT